MIDEIIELERGGSFLSNPMPERLHEVRFVAGVCETAGLFSIGTFVRTKDCQGAKIVPTKEVLFTIGTDEELEKAKFNIPASFARVLRSDSLSIFRPVSSTGPYRM